MNNGGTLAAGHTTSVTLTNASAFPNSGTVLIGTELITYANKAGNVLQTLGRGAQGTTDSTHADGSTVKDATNFVPWGQASGLGVDIEPGQWRLTNFGQ